MELILGWCSCLPSFNEW